MKPAKQKLFNRITTTTSVQDACANADLVVEAATENVDLKLADF
jgi:3-hydroxyacyl-CoA dehydrogenase